MADFSIYYLTAYNPPTAGDTDYPYVLNDYIDAVENTTLEIENARVLNSPNLLDTLKNNYLKNITQKNINGFNTYKLSNMPYATLASDYVPLAQLEILLGVTIPDLTDLTVSPPLDIHNAEYRCSSDGTSISTFDLQASSLSDSGTYLYPNEFNKTYYLNFFTGTSRTNVRLSHSGKVPKDGDRLRLMFVLPLTNYYIQDSTNKIMGLT